jgi:hypothetical protein
MVSLLLLGTLVACGTDGPAAPDGKRQAGPASVSPSEGGLPRPVTGTEWEALRRAELVLERRCMARAGFTLPPLRPAGRAAVEPPHMALVLADPAWARRHGYGPLVRTAGEIAANRAEDPVAAWARALTPQRRSAALRTWQGGGRDTVEVTLPSGTTTGRSSRGCTSEVRGELYGDFRTWFGADAVDRDITSLAVRRASADPAYTGVLPAWSRCLAARGLRHPSPQHLRDALAPSATRAKETASAVAEAECAVSTGLAKAAADAERRHLAALHTRYRADVVNARTMRLSALPEAARLLRTDPSAR